MSEQLLVGLADVQERLLPTLALVHELLRWRAQILLPPLQILRQEKTSPTFLIQCSQYRRLLMMRSHLLRNWI